MSDPTETLSTGTYLVRAHCPACGVVEDVPMSMVAVLTRAGDAADLRLKFGQQKAAHRCRQLRILDVDRATGEVLPFPDEPDRLSAP